jgi:hypothetical protein
MKIFRALFSGFLKSINAWKAILIFWFNTFLLISLITFPIKGAVKSGFGKSMITEKLTDGIDLSAVTDLLENTKNLIPSLSSGLFIFLLIGFLMNTFLSGGIFNSLKKSENKVSPSEFFAASSRNFWSFLVISLIISGIILFLGFLMVVLPVSITVQSKSHHEGAVFFTLLISGILYLISLMILYLIADYARVWQAGNENKACFSALGYGFTRTFGTFLTSFPVMLIAVIVQIIFALVAFGIIGHWEPSTGGGVFLLFIVSQFLVLIRILLKTWRYGSITSMAEIIDPLEKHIE